MKHYNKCGAPALFSASGQAIATVSTDQMNRPYAYKAIDGSRHMLRTPPGIAYDNCALEQAKKLGVRYFVVKDRETKRTWWTEAWRFDHFGFRVARGFYPQTGLGMSNWHEGSGPGPSMEGEPARIGPVAPPTGTRSLFDEVPA